jgi:hypothetical protein
MPGPAAPILFGKRVFRCKKPDGCPGDFTQDESINLPVDTMREDVDALRFRLFCRI